MAKHSSNKDDHPPAPPAPAELPLEQSLQQLEQLVQRMEGGEQSLDAALTDFEAGIKLVRGCRDSLEQAEQRVQILLGDQLGELTDEAAGSTQDD